MGSSPMQSLVPGDGFPMDLVVPSLVLREVAFAFATRSPAGRGDCRAREEGGGGCGVAERAGAGGEREGRGEGGDGAREGGEEGGGRADGERGERSREKEGGRGGKRIVTIVLRACTQCPVPT
eukprot:1726432-Rhodomonas_salina.1